MKFVCIKNHKKSNKCLICNSYLWNLQRVCCTRNSQLYHMRFFSLTQSNGEVNTQLLLHRTVYSRSDQQSSQRWRTSFLTQQYISTWVWSRTYNSVLDSLMLSRSSNQVSRSQVTKGTKTISLNLKIGSASQQETKNFCCISTSCFEINK